MIGDPLDRIDRVASAFGCLANLVGSASDLHLVESDSLALLLDILVAEQRAALALLRKADLEARRKAA